MMVLLNIKNYNIAVYYNCKISYKETATAFTLT